MKLLGVETPEIHPLTVKVNGESIDGTLQRFVSNIGGLNRVTAFEGLSDQAIESLAKNHILSWLIANNHVHQGQFIITSRDGKTGDNVVRIDNSIQWFLIDHDVLDIDYRPPTTWPIGSAGYGSFWRSWLSGRFPLSLERIYQWSYVISIIPDEFYAGIFEPAVRNKLERLANNGNSIDVHNSDFQQLYPDIIPTVNPDNFVGRMLERKRQIPSDVKKFYRRLAGLHPSRPQINFNKNVGAAAAQILSSLNERIEINKQQIASLPERSGHSEVVLQYPASTRAYKALTALTGKLLMGSFSDQKVETVRVGRALRNLLSQTKDPYELIAVKWAIKNLDKVTQNHKFGVFYPRAQLLNVMRYFEDTDYWDKPQSGACRDRR